MNDTVNEDAMLKEIAEGLIESRSVQGAESASLPLSATSLPKDLKKEMGLDVWPEDIQNDLLAVFQKITKYLEELTVEGKQDVGKEGQTFGQKFNQAMVTMPSKALVRGGLSAAIKAGGYAKGPLKPFKPAIQIGAFGSHLLGGSLGHVVGTIQALGRTRH